MRKLWKRLNYGSYKKILEVEEEVGETIKKTMQLEEYMHAISRWFKASI
jgi:hypothetical protein